MVLILKLLEYWIACALISIDAVILGGMVASNEEEIDPTTIVTCRKLVNTNKNHNNFN